jgi:hypothetical protein
MKMHTMHECLSLACKHAIECGMQEKATQPQEAWARFANDSTALDDWPSDSDSIETLYDAYKRVFYISRAIKEGCYAT